MESKIVEQISLVLDDSEAKWLRGVVQNPLWVDNPGDEQENDKLIRLAFWQALGGTVV